jgi:mannose-6-phosphate isomerase-like protein (cupin superfamily)
LSERCAGWSAPECDILRQHSDFLFTTPAKERSYVMRKIVLVIFVLLIASSVKAQSPTGATDITAAQVQAFIKDAPRDRNSDRPIRVIDVGGYRVGVFGVFRPKDTPPSATVHQTNVTETYYMLEGAGVLVTGGTLRKPVTPRQSGLGNWTDNGSEGIEGGVSRRLTKGDVVIIPGGVPHGWASLEGDITYLIVRSDPDKKVPLK